LESLYAGLLKFAALPEGAPSRSVDERARR
jgi:hypothetical protein